MENLNNNLHISDETRIALEKGALSNIKTYTNITDKMYSWVKKIDSLVKMADEKSLPIKNEKNTDIYNFQRLCEYSLLIGLIWLDITTAYRLFLNAKEKYETYIQ